MLGWVCRRCTASWGDRVTAPSLRPYQVAAIAAVQREFARGIRRTLVVLPTGCGKTVVFADLARHEVACQRRVLVLAHRGELLEQAQAKLTAVGTWAELEQAGRRAGAADVVVASVQTLRGRRLTALAPDTFGLIVVDEAHHATSPSYRAVLDHFTGALVLGVTATADRADGAALGTVFETCAYSYEMRAAIRDGWLAPILARRVMLDGVDLSNVRTMGGDLNQADLAAVMADAEAVHGVVGPLRDLAGARKTIVFGVDVKHARAIADALNQHEPGCALALDGTAGEDDRRRALAGFRVGRFRFLVNCALFTEGFDEPSVTCVAIARPTKSRALYTQMAGRGTRLAPGKTDCLLLDFVGNAGRHRLVGPVDVLGGRQIDDETRLEVERLIELGQLTIDAVIDQADAEVARRRAAASVSAVARYRAQEVDPFLGDFLVGIEPVAARSIDERATQAQLDDLEAIGMRKLPADLSRIEAMNLLQANARRRKAGLCSIKQARQLIRAGYDAKHMSFTEASRLCGQLAARNWKPMPAIKAAS
jgi:superfamily II DNA or RNA helicase